MPWVVDTCLVIDVLDDDPDFGRASAQLLDSKASDGLVLCPVSYVELAPAFLGDPARQHDFLSQVGLDYSAPWGWPETQAAHKAWARFVKMRRARRTPRRPIADVLIGAFATTRQGLLTRNRADFAPLFPSLTIGTPDAS
jgi:predicted nucleic acid-binding protein